MDKSLYLTTIKKRLTEEIREHIKSGASLSELNYINKALSLEIEEDNTNSATTLDTYAWVLFKNKDYEKALEAIDAVLELESKKPSAEILHHAGDIYFMNGMPEEALEFWEKALKLAPEDELLQRKVKHKTFFYE